MPVMTAMLMESAWFPLLRAERGRAVGDGGGDAGAAVGSGHGGVEADIHADPVLQHEDDQDAQAGAADRRHHEIASLAAGLRGIQRGTTRRYSRWRGRSGGPASVPRSR